MQRPVAEFAPTASGHMIETMKSAKALLSFPDRARRQGGITGVTGKDAGCCAQLLLRLIEIFVIAANGNDFSAMRDKRICRGKSNAAGSADDD